MSLPIDEIFPALQGEGERMGVPCVFVRTGGCNLRCKVSVVQLRVHWTVQR